MSDENVGGLVELPPLPDIGPEGWYTRADMIAYARAALSAHGQPEPRVSQAMLDSQLETARLLDDLEKRSEARREKYGLRGQPVVDDSMVKRAEDYFYDNSPFNGPDELREGIRAMLVAALGATP